MPKLRITRLTREQCDYYLDHGGINGSELEHDTSTTDEYDEQLTVLLANMKTVGKNGIDEDCPYFINLDAEPDYFPCIEVKDKSILVPSLVVRVHRAVLAMEDKYRVDICNAWCYLNDMFNVMVEHDKLYVCCDNNAISDGNAMIKSLGLNGAEFEY